MADSDLIAQEHEVSEFDIDTRVFYEAWPTVVSTTLNTLSVKTWRDLTKLSEAYLLTFQGFGRKSLRFVRGELELRGLTFQPQYDHRFWLFNKRQPHEPICGVYFMRCQGFVKIGHAKNIKLRFRQLVSGFPFPLELLAHIETEHKASACELERIVHVRFRALHHRGEWYRYEDDLVSYIEDLSRGR